MINESNLMTLHNCDWVINYDRSLLPNFLNELILTIQTN